jgi:NAD(P)-dependent dehydrogenase (short-subunit alcohol dehydrogenase family)
MLYNTSDEVHVPLVEAFKRKYRRKSAARPSTIPVWPLAAFSCSAVPVHSKLQQRGNVGARRRPRGSRCLALRTDLRQAAEIDRLIETVGERHAWLDFPFVNAGLGRAPPLEAVTEADAS